MAEPRKKKKQPKRKTGRPLEDVPLKRLLRDVKEELQEQIRVSFGDKPKRD